MDRGDLVKRGENDGLWEWNLVTDRIQFSPRWISMLGCEQHEIGNTPEEWLQRVHPEDLDQFRREIGAHLAGNLSQFENQHRLLHKDGTYRWMSCRVLIMRNKEGKAIRAAGSHSDITAEKVVDSLTGLPNRLLLLDRLSRSIECARRNSDFHFAVLILDLDRFKCHVERLGWAVGDQLLIAVARRLETCLRAGDTVARLGCDHVVARLGGDEFIILLEGLNQIGGAGTVAERLLKEISAPFEICGREVFLSASIGIALSVTGYSRPEEALRDADIAVFRAKSLGKDRCEFFDTAVLKSANLKLQLENELQEAIRRQEFLVFYQPVVCLASDKIAGFEALVRWNHPTQGIVSPDKFIPAAERSGLILPLGHWVLQEACRQLKSWQQEPGISNDLWVSVNLSGLQLMQPSLVDRIGEALNEIKLEPRCLTLELTESVMMGNPEAVSTLLMKLRVLGVQLSLDDFGTGYSSLSYLRQFPLDFLKIDRSFIQRMRSGKEAMEIVQTISGLAHQLGLHLVAEGIETVEQLESVRSLSCEYGQGYLFCQAVRAEEAKALLKTGLSAHLAANSGEERVQAGIAVEPSRGFDAAAANGLHTRSLLRTLTKRRFAGRLVFLYFLLAALIPLLVGGFVARFRRGTSAAVHSSLPDLLTARGTAPGERAVAPYPTQARREASFQPPLTANRPQPMVLGNKNSMPLNPGTTASKSPLPLMAESRERTFPVVHNHVLGSCRGVLRISRESICFSPEKEKDGFTLRYGEFTCLSSDDRLTLKSGSKTYRFRSATATSKIESRARIQEIVQLISGMHPGIGSK